MIIKSLVDYYEALAKLGKITKPGYVGTGVSFGLCISNDGDLIAIVPLKEEVIRGKKTVEIPQKLVVPEQVIRSVGIKPNFLCDNCGYFLGIDNKGKSERIIDCFQAAKDLHNKILFDIDDTSAKAICAFFDQWEPSKALENEVLKPYLDEILKGANLVFMLENFDYVHNVASVKNAWENYRQESQATEKRLCMITGEKAVPAILHGKIKGVKGAQSVGANLISFNATALESYGNSDAQGLNAPVSEYAVYAYVTALNHLIADKAHCQIVGDTTVVYWAENGEEKIQDWFNSVALNGGFEEDNALLSSIMKKVSEGNLSNIEGIDFSTNFCILGIAPNAARLSVRFFLRNNFGEFLKSIVEHYERLKIAKPSFEKEFLTPYMLLKETVSPNSRDQSASPLLSGAVMRSILTDTKYPESLYNAVIVRIRAEKNITSGKAAIIKAYLLKNYEDNLSLKEELTMALNEESTNKAYVLGRLFSVLEKVQLEANPGINTTIKDRYFTSACVTPGTVFPSLLRLANYHLGKSRFGSKDIGELIGKLDGEPLPDRLTLKEQGMFILGYYHQVQKRYEKRSNNDTQINEENEEKEEEVTCNG